MLILLVVLITLSAVISIVNILAIIDFLHRKATDHAHQHIWQALPIRSLN